MFVPIRSPGLWPDVRGLSLDAAAVKEQGSAKSCQQEAELPFYWVMAGLLQALGPTAPALGLALRAGLEGWH